MITFKETLKQFRTSKGYTQQELADLLKISKSTVSMYENGNRQPDFETIELLADFFNVTVPELICSPDDETLKESHIVAKTYIDSVWSEFKRGLGLTDEELQKIKSFTDFIIAQRIPHI